MKGIVFTALLIILASGSVQAQSSTPVAGDDYIEIPDGRPLEPAEDMVVVEEFFNYVCPACNAFEPQFARWAAELPPYVKVVHVPASFRADFMQYARAYYAAELFGLVDKTHTAVYEAIHGTHTLPAEGDPPDEKRIAEFYAGFGVDAQEFLTAMQSFGVSVKVHRAAQHMHRSKATSTPSIVIDGRYLVRGASFADMLRIASYLIEREHSSETALE